MKQVDLREINKIVSQFRAHTRALKRLAEGGEIEAHFASRYGNTKIQISDTEALNNAVKVILESTVAKLKKKLAELGIDPVETPKKAKKAKAA